MQRLLSAALLTLLLCLGGCGLTRVRASQDWSGADDPRLDLACHIGNYGSGVLLSCDGAGALVLTCAHLVEDREEVPVHFHDRTQGKWVTYDGLVMRRSHPHKEDLALIVLDTTEFHLTPRQTLLAERLRPGEEVTATLANIAFGAEERPFLLDLPALAHVTSVSSFRPDEHGETSWELPKVLVHGGVTQANSGSPVFLGDRLLGLAESPGFAPTEGGLLTGITVTAPTSVHAFLDRPDR